MLMSTFLFLDGMFQRFKSLQFGATRDFLIPQKYTATVPLLYSNLEFNSLNKSIKLLHPWSGSYKKNSLLEKSTKYNDGSIL